MIQRRRPIESAIAERKMFNMGGMAAPMQQPTYMDLMQQGIMGMPQQQMGMPQQQMGMQQPQGIMASSQPLVDAIAADANNPAGGNTLSMAQGGLASEELMARGFENGGVNQLLIRPGSREERRIEMGRAPEAFSDATVGDYSIFNSQLQDALRLRQRSLDKLKPINRAFYGEVARGLGTASDYLTVTSEEKAENDKRREAESAKSVGFNSREELNAEQQRIEMIPLDVWLQQVGATGKTREYFLNPNNLGSALSDIRIGEPDEDEAAPESYEPRLPPSDFELNPDPEDLIRADANMDPNAPGDRPQGEIVPEAPGGKIVLAEGISVAAADDSDVPRPKDKPPIPQGPFDVEGEIVPGEEPPAGTGGVLDEVDAAAYTAAQNVVAKTLDTDKKADGKTIDDFKKQFMEAMPKYEGMSEEEKGFLIAEAGLRVMAGKDPNAITNIAEGLKGLGPALMKGAKEKRAWNRQVELSAAKYALEGTARADAKADALAKEGRVRKQFIVGKTFTDLSGVKREKGSLYTPTAAEMGTDSFQRNILPNLTTEGIYKERLDNAGALTGIVRVGAKHGPSAEGVTKALDTYTDLTKDVRNNAKMLTMLDSSIVQNAKGEVTGFAPWASKKINQLKNAAGYNKQIKILDGIDTSTGQGLERFQYQQQVIANMMLKEILGEGSKNVSNIDRTLASEIVGLLKGFSSVYADPAVLHQKLQGIRGVVQQGLRGSLTKMRNSEVGFGNTFTAFAPGSPGLNVSGQMAEQRRSLLGDIQGVGQRTQSRSEAAGRAPVVLKASDYFDFDKMTIRKNLP